jgi:hypothetical protein
VINFAVNTSPEITKLLDDAQWRRAAQVASIATAKELEAEARPYPGPVVSPVTWESEKQRRFYFAQRREMGLPPGYTRQSDPMSERLLESWVVEPYGELGAILKNSATYAPYVIGDDQQQQHALTGWQKLTDVANEFFSSGKGDETFEKVFIQAVRE